MRRAGSALGPLALLACCALLSPAAAEAQTTIDLVKNTGQSHATPVGASVRSGQSFRTGPDAGGYTITEIKIHYRTSGTAVTVTIHGDSGGDPGGTVLATLGGGGTGTGIRTFGPTSTTLAANTTYWVVVNDPAGSDFSTTSSNSEDSGARSGWSIGDTYKWYETVTSSWKSDSESMSLAIRGYANDPTVIRLDPADGAAGVAVDGNLVITFDEAVRKGTGNITIHPASGAADTIDVASGRVTVGAGSSANVVTIDPASDLATETDYHVRIDATAFDDLANNSYAGISDAETWNFSTADTTDPTVTGLSPRDGAAGVAVDGNLVVTFDEAVRKGTGNITIHPASGAADTVDVASGRVTVGAGSSANVVTIDPAADLATETDYHVRIDATAFDDLANNSYAGISDAGTWNFSTAETGDGGGGGGGATANRAPVFSSPSTFEVPENRVVVGGVVATDPDPEDDVTGYAFAGGADQPRFSITATGVLTFRAPPDYESPQGAGGGNEYVVAVRATSGAGTRERIADQTITVRVLPVNDAPAALDDEAETLEDEAVAVDVLANDSDPDGDGLRIESVSAPDNGTVAVFKGGILYTPTADYHGPDRFTYTVSDAGGLTSEAAVDVTVLPVNDAPQAAEDEAETPEDEAVAVDVLANDSDPDGDGLRIESVSAPEHGTAAVTGDEIVYAPAANYHGLDRFTYTVSDAGGLTSEAAVEVTVTPVNDAPRATGDEAETAEDEPVWIDVLANDSDPDGDALRIESVSAPERGTAAVSGGRVLYTPDADYHGTDRFTYTVLDDGGLTSEAAVSVTVAPVNDAPEAAGDEAETREDEPVWIDVLANDSDPDGDGLRIESVSAPDNGTAKVSGDRILYTPDPNYHGPDRFAYVVSDGNGLTAEAAVEVTVAPVNDAPEAVGRIPDQALEEGDGAAAVELGPFFRDADGDALAYRAESSDPAVVSASMAGSVLELTPVVYGSATVTVTAEDAGGLSAAQTFAVRVGDARPREAVSLALAGLARSHLASARMTLGRRVTARRAEGSRLTLLGREVPLRGASARAAVGRAWADWLSGVRARAEAGAAEGLGDLLRPGDVLRLDAGRDPLLGSEFLLSLGGGQDAGGGNGPRFSLWGQGDVQTFEGAPEAAGYDGELRTAWAGADVSFGARWLAGVAVSRSLGDAGWRATGAGGSLDTRMVAAHPYLRWSDGATSVWAMVGAGRGDAENVRDRGRGRAEKSGLGLRMGLSELRRRVAATGGFEFSLRADAAWAELKTDDGDETLDRQTATVDQLRLGAELSQRFRLGGLTLTPFGEAHARRDGGDGQAGRGIEVAGGLRASVGILSIDAQGRLLALHTAEGYEERGFGVTLGLGSPGGEGPSLSVSPRWGDAAWGGGALWEDETRRRRVPAEAEPDAPWALDLRGGYGIRVPGGRTLNWSAALNHSPAGPRFTLGAQVEIR